MFIQLHRVFILLKIQKLQLQIYIMISFDLEFDARSFLTSVIGKIFMVSLKHLVKIKFCLG